MDNNISFIESAMSNLGFLFTNDKSEEILIISLKEKINNDIYYEVMNITTIKKKLTSFNDNDIINLHYIEYISYIDVNTINKDYSLKEKYPDIDKVCYLKERLFKLRKNTLKLILDKLISKKYIYTIDDDMNINIYNASNHTIFDKYTNETNIESLINNKVEIIHSNGHVSTGHITGYNDKTHELGFTESLSFLKENLYNSIFILRIHNLYYDSKDSPYVIRNLAINDIDSKSIKGKTHNLDFIKEYVNFKDDVKIIRDNGSNFIDYTFFINMITTNK
ncbi:hypothetical protein FPHOBKDP_00035 [Listeria phage LPJP1]|nr:hypothetical protein FPHOBKDP_00035 [Listeria phage LPJP1]